MKLTWESPRFVLNNAHHTDSTVCTLFQKRKQKNAHENAERVVYKEIVKENPNFEKYYKVKTWLLCTYGPLYPSIIGAETCT